MVYTAEYDLATRCGAEIIATAFALYIGAAGIANGLLPGSKGQSMGYGWICFDYGFAFFYSGLLFGVISAYCNPALTLAYVIIGDIDVGDFFALSISQIVGAFLGAVFAWLHFLPHFKTVPEPPPMATGDMLLRKRDTLSKETMQIASYNTEPSKKGGEGQRYNPKSWWQDVSYYIGINGRYRADPKSRRTTPGQDISFQPLVVNEDEASAPGIEPPDVDHPEHHEVTQHELQQQYVDEEMRRQALLLGDQGGETASVTGDANNNSNQSLHAGGSGLGNGNGSGQGHGPPVAASFRIDVDALKKATALAQQKAAVETEGRQYPYTSIATGANAVGMSGGEDMPVHVARPKPPAAGGGSATQMQGKSEPNLATNSVPHVFHARFNVPDRDSHGDHGSQGNLVPPKPAASFTAMGRPVPSGKSYTRKYTHGSVDGGSVTSSFTGGHGHGRFVAPGAIKRIKAAAKKQKLTAMDAERARLIKLYEAAIVADQNVKLVVFATRPAIYSPLLNFLCEFLSTVMLLGGIMLLQEQGQRWTDAVSTDVWGMLQGFYIGLYILVLQLGLGGPTGLACNPARDLGPRLAHQILPIPNKGPSEWHYAWIPFFADFAGGAVAGVVFLGIRHMEFPTSSV